VTALRLPERERVYLPSNRSFVSREPETLAALRIKVSIVMPRYRGVFDYGVQGQIIVVHSTTLKGTRSAASTVGGGVLFDDVVTNP